ncbi:hypothetical protein MPY17_35635 [Rhodococcus opacus]|uniref:hypothetical protein n=1 Tax=Rhodococcus opacus TaxID=37919 RepID=UPI001FF192C8|nr:hypothetical protein [Rhodococcus opacus]UOT04143.1 hypothetical protein MPY17_35635 [Rhodococcus opacus]
MSGVSGPSAVPVHEPASSNDRFGPLIERRDDADFPFYNGTPTALSVRQWALAWASVAVGFAALVLLPQTDNFVALIPRILFVGIPLVVLARVVRSTPPRSTSEPGSSWSAKKSSPSSRSSR